MSLLNHHKFIYRWQQGNFSSLVWRQMYRFTSYSLFPENDLKMQWQLYIINQKMHISIINILIFNCLWLLHVSKPRVHLQEDGCFFRYGIVCFTCISASSLVGRRVCSIQPSSWRWTFGFETCRRHQKLRIKILI